ncbi:MAG: type IV pilus twitching motility protein PilT [Deltaproteobacteria bacterium]|nr:type IV pilus twitching motility protein PilT [Deltaproteobacteria bacterium]MCW5806844.1 type IV pilus twitching motility protein PilT [Deltaproteobacteria bacterium]
MAAIDAYIGYLTKFGASAIILESGKQILVRLPSGDRPATQTLAHATLQALVEECAPPDALGDLMVNGSTEFDYHRGPQPVRCTVSATSWSIRLELAVANAAEPAPAPAPPPPARPAVAHSSPAAMTQPIATAPSRVAPPSQIHGGGGPRIDQMLRAMREMGASDLHLSCSMPPLVRKDGEMKPVPGFPVNTPESMLALLYDICPEKNREEFEARNDTDFAYEIVGLSRFRANMFRDRRGPGGVFRAIPFDILTPSQLGLPAKVLELCYLTKGLVLVTGPTGSGKSTTLAALIDYVNAHRSDHIITIEDPIEFVHENKKCLVNQREVHVHTSSFKDALRAALREDPDIVLVGEMRDLETVAIAVETAETGHLVFGTLHTTTAPSTIDRIIDQFPADRQGQVRQMLAESLRGVIAQTLCKKIGGGRVAAYEILIGTSAVRNLIRTAKTYQLTSIMQTGKDVGMITLNDSLLDLVKAKKVEPLEAYMKSVNKAELKAALQKLGHTINVADDKE